MLEPLMEPCSAGIASAAAPGFILLVIRQSRKRWSQYSSFLFGLVINHE
jgi:hypothetical protein